MVESQDTPCNTCIFEEALPILINRWPQCALERAVFSASDGYARHSMLIVQVTKMSLRTLITLFTLITPFFVEEAHWPASIHLVDQTLGHQ